MQKILLIDDEEVFRVTTRMVLQRQGYEIHEAADGAAGVEVARRILPDLVLCDVNMERLDGYATLEALREQPETATIPFILMTGMTGDDIMRRGMNLGADDFLEKPFTPPQLFAAIEARLRKHQTLQKTAERKLAELRSNLSLALPHEMITPLNGIFGLADIITTDAATLRPEEISELARGITSSAERLHHLVQNFILFGQLELLATDAGARAELQTACTADLRNLISRRLAERAGKCGRKEDARGTVEDSNVRMKPEMFTKLVDELVDNAFKFSLPGSPVTVSGHRTGQVYHLSVSDQGDGMAPEQIARIGAYSQFDRHSREQQGSGLGLAIAKRLTELHQGEFRIQSEPGRGTTVSIRLPAVV